MEEREPNALLHFRKSLFRKVFPNEDIMKMNQNFFELESHQILEVDKLLYYDYYSELRKNEIKIKQDQDLIRQNHVKSILSTFYGREIVNILMKNLPANRFYDEVQNIDRNAVLDALRNIFTDANESLIESHCKKIYFKVFGIQSDEDMDVVPLYIPKLPSNSKIITVKDTRSEFFPHRFIYVRNCFEKMFKSVSHKCCFTDTGISNNSNRGKFYNARYMFLRIKDDFNSLKIYWEMESGQWIFYDGLQLKTGIQDNVNWSDDNVLVLIDGK